MQRFLQTPFWAEFKAAHGWTARYFVLAQDGDSTGVHPAPESGTVTKTDSSIPFVVLTRSFSVARVKRFSLAYIPLWPEHDLLLGGDGAVPVPTERSSAGTGTALSPTERSVGGQQGAVGKNERSLVPSAKEETLASAALALCDVAQGLRAFLPPDTLFVRFDPALDFPTPGERDSFAGALDSYAREKRLLLTRSPVAVQPPDTTILELTKSEDELLSAMKSKWRYNIRLAEKKGVTVTRHYGSDADFDSAFSTFYALFMQTSERDGVSFHGKDYYRDLLRRGSPEGTQSGKPLVTLYLARHEEDYLAGIITLFCGGEAVYLYGASGNTKRNLMPAYLLQWTAIRDAKAAGCPCYDFYGMPPDADESHPMHGLYLFKTGFGGQNTHRIGSWDVPLKKGGYRFYLAAEKGRAWFHRKLLKKLKGR